MGIINESFSGSTLERWTFLIVGDHVLIRDGIKRALAAIRPDARALEVDSLVDAVTAFRSVRDVGVVVVDVSSLSNYANRLDELNKHFCGAAVILVSTLGGDVEAHTALLAGIRGVVPRHASSQALSDAIRHVLQGRLYLLSTYTQAAHGSAGGEVRPRHRGAPDPNPRSPTSSLTDRQQDVLHLLARGLSNKEICRQLNLSVSTVKGHVTAIYQSLNVGSRCELIAKIRGGPPE